MQIAHPLIAEGVDQHSDFRADPWRRLRGTLRSYLAIVYGTTAEARAEIRRLNELHRRVSGPVRDPLARAVSGTPTYDARDPDLGLWVHATLIDATIVAHDAWIRPLDRSARRRFYAETRPIGRALGVPESRLPVDHEAFEDYLASQLGSGRSDPGHADCPRAGSDDLSRRPLGRSIRCSARSPHRCTPGPCGRRSTCCPTGSATTTA